MKPNLFNSIKMMRPKKNVFDLSHDVKLTLDMGKLIPTLAMECVPGDSFTISCESLLRFAPLVAPMMHRVDVTMHYFFVPNRILWNGWEAFITGGQDGQAQEGDFPRFNVSDVEDYIDTLSADDQVQTTKFLDYMGIPYNTGESFEFNALPFAAYQSVYSEYYRDQNLITEVPYKVQSGIQQPDAMETLLVQRYRAWEHDYFTASLPWAQKGQAVDIPIGLGSTNVPVYVNNGGTDIDLSGTPNNIEVTGQSATGVPVDQLYAETEGLQFEPTTINDLRRAFKLQEWLEKNARGGTRYIESILSHFGVKSSDKRLQRPEYITGVKSPVVISEVLNTAGFDNGTDALPQGNMAGHGISVQSGNYGKYYCEEHGFIIGVMSVMPKTAYQQGLHKSWQKFDKLDYFWPSFAHIGEQPVKGIEIYANGSDDYDTVFGYVPRYAEYKYLPSRVAGDFRTSPLDSWHLGRIFDEQPTLSQEFVECKPSKRIFAVTEPNIDSLYCHIYHKIKAVRPMPKFGTPMF